MNKVILIGRMTEDPELRTILDKGSVINFTLAVKRKFHPSNGPDTDFIRCCAWGNAANFIEHWFTKGDKLCIIGHLQNSKYTDQHGETKYSTVVQVEEVYFTGQSMPKD